jgi:import inner membrane translocase subunit TIM44
MAQWSHTYAESDNPFIVMSRSVTGTIGRWFDETETAKVTKWVKELDPSFTQEGFLKELREYIVPELVDAYVNGDQPTLKQWCSEAVSCPPLSYLSPSGLTSQLSRRLSTFSSLLLVTRLDLR